MPRRAGRWIRRRSSVLAIYTDARGNGVGDTTTPRLRSGLSGYLLRLVALTIVLQLLAGQPDWDDVAEQTAD
jgi:hypothetical protein